MLQIVKSLFIRCTPILYGIIVLVFLVPFVSLRAQELGPCSMAYHSLVVHADGTVYAWGCNDKGQLGDGNTTNLDLPIKVLKGAYSGSTYLGDNPDNKIIAVAGGREHSLALAADGTVFAWGENAYGRLGDNTTTDRLIPIKVLMGAYSGTTYLGDNPSNKIIAIAAGRYSSTALAQDGNVYAWGRNYYGELGDGSTTERHMPIKVVKGAYNGSTYLGDDTDNKIIAVARGESHALAVAADGTVFGWGYSATGQVGDGFTSNRSAPVFVVKGEYAGTTNLGDDSGNKMIAVAAGGHHSAALADNGHVYAWGAGNSGQLGNNSISHSYSPVHVHKGDYPGNTYLGDSTNNKITSLALGYYSCAGLAEDGRVYSWGFNGWYTLGDGTNINRLTPIRVLKGAYDGTTYLGDAGGNPIEAIALGTDFCLALGSNNKVYAWGANSYNQLGDNSITTRSIPIIVHGVDDAGDLSLPVELSSFGATSTRSDAITLAWITESEVDNLGFILERRTAAAGWIEIASYITHPKLQGQGSVTYRTDYSFTDETVEPGNIYDYRLADVSYDGVVEYHNMMVLGVRSLELPAQIQLQAAYPNPFNPITTIRYGLYQNSYVTITIYNLLGKEVEILISETQTAGDKSVQWDATNVASGMYFYQIRAGEFVQTRKMVVLK